MSLAKTLPYAPPRKYPSLNSQNLVAPEDNRCLSIAPHKRLKLPRRKVGRLQVLDPLWDASEHEVK
jgi:hypothetical protein